MEQSVGPELPGLRGELVTGISIVCFGFAV